MEILGKVRDGNQSCRVNRQSSVLQADEGDEQTDSHGNGTLQRQGDGVEDSFPHVGKGEDNENDTLNKYGKERYLPGKAHSAAYGVCHVGVQSHAGGKGEGQVCPQSHADGSHEGCETGCQQNGGAVHAGGGKDAGVDCQDVRHGHERGQTGSQFGFHIGFVCLEFE